MQLFQIILFWTFFGLTCSYLAKKRGKNSFLWFFIGLFLGIFGVFLILILPLIEKKLTTPQKRSEETFSPPAEPEMERLEEWFYLNAERKAIGPVSYRDLSSLVRENQLTKDSYIWTEGMVEWKKVIDFPEFEKN